MQLILASNSWIRKILLDKVGIQYIIDVPDVDEEPINKTIADPHQRVLKLAELKAKAVAKKYANTDALILGSDSVNLRNGIVLGKPKSREHAIEMIKAASNGKDVQITGWCVVNAKTDKMWSGVEELHFEFLPMSDDAINTYLNDPDSHAYLCSGGFSIGSQFYFRHCARVNGSNGLHYALPIEKIIPILQENGFKI
ncbi:MAG: Maf family protein [Candidatus Woesearchaeota archaeon]|jgi:MAF protein